MAHLRKILEYYRVKDWFYHLGFVYLGMVYASGSYITSPKNMLIGLIMGSLYLGGGYSYNKLCDSREISRIKLVFALSWYALFIILGIHYLRENTVFFIIAMLLNIFYSHPKYLLKKEHVLRVLMNGYFFGILFLLGGLIIPGGILDKRLGLMTAFFILIMYPYEIIHEISHFEDDGIKYSATLIRRYARQIYALLLVSSIFAYFLFYSLKLSSLFIIASILFNIVFFIIIFRRLNYSRIILRCLGFLYGILLWLSFIKMR